jgi:radical SAM protein with 4Fe4S-binding SPASM domain
MVQQFMTLDDKIAEYKGQFDVLALVDLDHWHQLTIYQRDPWLRSQLHRLYQPAYQNNQRILFRITRCKDIATILNRLQHWLFKIDISNFFAVVLTNDPDVRTNWQSGPDTSDITFDVYHSEEYIADQLSIYQYNSTDLVRATDLTMREQFLLTESKTFCMYPWIHLHAYPTGEAYPCCHAEMGVGLIGNCRTNTLAEIWNSDKQKQLRQDMLRETFNSTCGRCYEQEDNGFFSGRRSANKHHGHNISRVAQTQTDGTLNKFEMTYWDIRFSNLCNLKCRSCGHIFSSQWYQDQARLAGEDWRDRNTVLNYAGRTELDMWEQLEPHLDYVEQIYFAGGEPLLMEEHYRILDELVHRKKFDVRLIYNTNFTHTDLKGRSVFEYWQQFDSVAVGASLDDSGARGEYIRKGTDWAVVEQNRREMMQVCPGVDFYISPTLSIMNAWHLPDFHRDWVERGLIRAQDLNVNILQDPLHYRIDIAPAEYKQHLATKYFDHILWLRDRDSLGRATQGFESAITFMMATDNTHLVDTFWRKTHELDAIRKENILDVIPELAALK